MTDTNTPDSSFAAKDFNAILEALARARLTESENRACWFLLRKTYGWHKTEDVLSLATWAEGTNMHRGNLQHTVEDLLRKRVLVRRQVGTQSFAYGLNRDVDAWDASVFERESYRANSLHRDRGVENASTVVPTHDSETAENGDNCSVPTRQDCSVPTRATVVSPHTHKAINKANNKAKREGGGQDRETRPAAAGPPPNGPPGKKGKPAREPPPPGVEFYREVIQRYPARALFERIDQAISVRRDEAFLKRCHETWIARGYNPKNLDGWFFDWYVSGVIPAQGDKTNGKSKQPAQRGPDPHVRDALQRAQDELDQILGQTGT